MLNISLQHKMMMKLSPQQVQYLKMLQLPTLALEQKIKAELEMNPLLEEGFEEEMEADAGPGRGSRRRRQTAKTEEPTEQAEEDKYTIEDYMNDDQSGYKAREPFDDEEKDELPIPDAIPLYHRLLEQFSLLDLDDEEILIGQEIIGNIDEDGYLRRDLALHRPGPQSHARDGHHARQGRSGAEEDPAARPGRHRLAGPCRNACSSSSKCSDVDPA